ncbi:MAG: glutamate--tRNA ligase, partial [candidate division KSB1 bacterium]
APSPTGYLHIGGARTAIFNWLYAKKHGGKFFLRIEDTDVKRSGEEMTRAIIDSLRWLGLDWEGEPIKQSERMEIYRKHAQRLLQSGHAYRSFTTEEEAAQVRKRMTSEKKTFIYREHFPKPTPEHEAQWLAEKKPFAIRLEVPGGATEFDDQVQGKVKFEHAIIDDFVILRSDEYPTYHLAVVVDDHVMGITHVIRGADHISNTPKQIMLYRALGWKMPAFAHVPLILGADKTRLSKRHGATAVGEYEKKGILPETLFNFLTLLGWSPGDDRELLTREELIALFDINAVSKSNAVFDERKLAWMNGQYLNRVDLERLIELVSIALVEAGFASGEKLETQKEYLRGVITLLRSRVRTIPEFIEQGVYFWRDPEEYETGARIKHWAETETSAWLAALAEVYKSLPAFNVSEVERSLRELAEGFKVSAGKLIHAARLAVTGLGVSPSFFETVALLGKQKVVLRLEAAVRFLKAAK